MKFSALSVLSFTLLKSTLVLGQEFFEILTIYPDDSCDPNGETHVLESPEEMPACSSGFFIPNSPPWEIDGDILTFYADPSSAPEGCTVVFWQPNFDSDVRCSIPIAKFTSGQVGCVKASQNMNSFNYGWCCSDNCDTAIPDSIPEAGNDTSAIENNKVRDVTAVKRAAPGALLGAESSKYDNIAKRQTDKDGCAFTPSGDRYTLSFTPVQVVPVALCSSEEGCEYSGSQSMSFSYSQTFEISSEVGATILEVIQASVSFSYSETYTEETSTEVSYTVTVPNGQRGYISFTPTYECFDGSFAGDNCRAAVDKDGLCYLCTFIPLSEC